MLTSRRAKAKAQALIRRKETEKYKAEERMAAAEAHDDVAARQEFAADRALRYGKTPDERQIVKIKLNEEAVNNILGPDHAIKDLVSPDGVHPDDLPFIAALGYSTGTELVRGLQSLNNARTASWHDAEEILRYDS